MLVIAGQRWPEVVGARNLMLHLMAEGAESLRGRELEAAYADAYADWAGSEDERLWGAADADWFGAQ